MTALILSLLMFVSVSWNVPSSDADTPPDTATVVVRVDGARSTDGRVLVALFDSDDGFPRTLRKAAYTASAPLRKDSAFVKITDVQEGDYAVFAVHDADGDGRLDTNWLGMPTEGIALSKWTGGRPEFEDSTVDVGPDTTTVALTFYYR